MTQKKENDFAAEERCAKEVQLTSEQLERKAKKVEQHENMLKSMGVEQTKKPMKAAAGKEERTGKKIGISNPFVLTELILDKQIDWSNPQSEILIEETLESSYEDLIHKEDSVLLACQNDNPAIREEVDYDTVANVANTDQLHKLMGCKQLDVISSQKKGNKISLEVLIPEKREKALCSSLVSKLIKELVKPGSAQEKGGLRASDPNSEVLRFFEMGLGQTFIPDRYNSIMQGVLGDCYYLAALCSIAWVWPGLLKMDVDLGSSSQPLSYWHYFNASGHSNTTSSYGKTDNRFLFKGDYNMPIYARGRRWFDGDLWAAYWEKLYATWRYRGVKGNLPNTDQEMKDAFNMINGGWPDYSLREIAGGIFDVGTIDLNTVSYSALKNFFYNNTNSYWVTNYPMVLWTFRSTLPNLPNYHAYSILGVIVYNGKYYIVIRNPWGRTEPTGAGTLGGTYSLKHFYETILNSNNPQSSVFTFSDDDGVFAMELDLMRKQFSGLGYIY